VKRVIIKKEKKGIIGSVNNDQSDNKDKKADKEKKDDKDKKDDNGNLEASERKDVFHFRMIPFEEEKDTLLEIGHNKLLHSGANETRYNIMRMGFYWYTYVHEINEYISNCDSCLIRKANKIQQGVTPIVSEYPNQMHVMDTMEIHSFLKARFNNKYTHIFNIIDHFSRFSFSFLIKHPNAEIITDKLKLLFTNHIPEKILSDNGGEFRNNKVSNLLNSYSINQIFGRPRNPRTQGVVEAYNKYIHRKLFIAVLNNPSINQTNCELVMARLVYEYNHRVHGTVKIKPYQAISLDKDSNKADITKIQSNMLRTIKKRKPNIKPNDYVLISRNFEKKGNVLQYLKPSKRGEFIFNSIPGLVHSITEYGKIMIRILKTINSKRIEEGDILEVNANLLCLANEKVCLRLKDRFNEEEILNKY
jgi:hypothetical protein